MLALAVLLALPVIVDTDCAAFGDDGGALVMLLRSQEKVTVEGISLVSGNVWAVESARHVPRILERIGGPRPPLFHGAQMPLVHTAAMADREGKLEFRGAFASQPPPAGPARQPDAVNWLIEAVERAPGEVTVLALGPMTNLAIALRLRPEIERKIGRLVFMGGNVRVPGNSSAAAEFNFWFDPEAASVVLRSAIPEKVMFGLDITNRARMTRKEFDEIAGAKTPVTELYRDDMGHRYPGFLRDSKAVGYLWDELAAAWLLDPGFVTRSETLFLDVDTRFGTTYGAVVPLDRGLAPRATPVKVMLDLDFARVFGLYKDLLTR
jgi:inosine-uridine nucleoside N-ribohydrolase